MKAVWFVTISVAASLEVASATAGCSSSNNPSTSSTSGGGEDSGTASTTSSSGGGSTSSGSSTSSSGTTSSSGSTSGGTSSSGASSGDLSCDVAVDGGVTDKVTTCTTGTSPDCTKGCGPDLPAGGSQTNLGNKTCSCTAGTYECADCVYESPLPSCYQPSAPPAACAAGTADKASCTTPCSGTQTGAVCTLTTDAGKTDGCVCIAGSTGNVWTCQTQWW